MSEMSCRWTRARLPLFAGGDLGGLDRRRVERHLISCDGCRVHRDGLGSALNVLHFAAAFDPTTSGTPSLWPEIADEIRQSRHPAAGHLGWASIFWAPRTLGLGFGLAATIAALAILALPRQDEPRPAQVAAQAETDQMGDDHQPDANRPEGELAALDPKDQPAPAPTPVAKPEPETSRGTGNNANNREPATLSN
ncbi:zf-HC2 domain-containing protein [Isosphaeraceae bacterium EP7]